MLKTSHCSERQYSPRNGVTLSHGAERAVVLSIEEDRVFVAHEPDFKAYLLRGPNADDFSIEREHDVGASYLWARASL